MEDYLRSNKEECVYLNKFSKKYSNKLLGLSNDSSNNTRKCEAQNLINYLCDKYKIKRVSVFIYDKKRPCKGNKQVYGRYIRIGNVPDKIVIYNRTAKRGDIISIKECFDTLLHEFIHHYDYEVLNMIVSTHTSGFYKRISDLKKKLV